MATPALLALLLSFGLAAAIDQLARRHKIGLAIPRPRDLHTEPTPRWGGLAIFVSFCLITIFWQQLHPDQFAGLNFPFALLGWSIDKRLLGILLGGLVLTVVMLIDDWRGLPVSWKLLGQIVSAAIVVASSVELSSFRLPLGHLATINLWQIPVQLGNVTYHLVPVADLLLIFWLVLLMNAMNFLDGLDGLATSVGAIATVTIILLSLTTIVNQPAIALLGFILLGSLFGFLPWNWHPARLFLGDSGATLIGFLLGVLSVISGSKVATLGLVLGLPILDLAFVFISRLLQHKNPFKSPGQDHLHHRLLKAGLSVPQTTLLYTSLAGLLGLSTLMTGTNGKFVVLLIVLVALAGLISYLNLRLAKAR